MDIKDNQKFNSEQNQPPNEDIESVTQNGSTQDQEQENEGSEDNRFKEDQDIGEGKEQEGAGLQEGKAELYTSNTNPGRDYNTYSREQLVERLRELLNSNKAEHIKKEVDIIKAVYYKKQRDVHEEQKKKLISEGGDPEDFTPQKDDLEEEFKKLLMQYKDRKAQVNKNIEEQKNKNLEEKYNIIEELKHLINKKESLDQTFKEFRELQRRWRETGPVPQKRDKYLWGTYHHHVEKFYDYVKINKELRDLDLKKNLEAKLDLCEKAEKLEDESNIVLAFSSLQDYHAQWRKIGPVRNERREEIWERFKEATRVINKRHQEYFKELRKKEHENLEIKQSLCQKAEEIAAQEIETHKEWNRYTRDILDLQKEWRKIGFAPQKHNSKIYHRFRKACDRFFTKKRVFYLQRREWQENNMKKKLELIDRAEALKDNTDWDRTAKDLIDLQQKWKKIGDVPQNQTEKLRERFRSACNHFFDNKKQNETKANKDFVENLQNKKDLIEKIKNFQPGENPEENKKQLEQYEEKWASIGFVPYKYKDKIQQDYRDAIYHQYDKLNIDKHEKELLKYQTKLKNIKQKPKSENRMEQEREKFINKIKKLENNINTWENNLGFISAETKTGNSMLNDFKEKIENAKDEIILLEEKVRLIDKLDEEE